MRELSEAELRLISGGYDYGEDIVVTGSPYPPPPYYPPPYYPPPPPPPPYGGGGGGGGLDGTQYAQWQAWVGEKAAEWVIDYLTNKAADAGQRETKIADQFNPSQVVQNIQGMDRNGNIDRGWQMQDGSAFFDTNGNGTPDMRMWTDPVGNVWSDEGGGKTLVRGVG